MAYARKHMWERLKDAKQDLFNGWDIFPEGSLLSEVFSRDECDHQNNASASVTYNSKQFIFNPYFVKKLNTFHD